MVKVRAAGALTVHQPCMPVKKTMHCQAPACHAALPQLSVHTLSINFVDLGDLSLPATQGACQVGFLPLVDAFQAERRASGNVQC